MFLLKISGFITTNADGKRSPSLVKIHHGPTVPLNVELLDLALYPDKHQHLMGSSLSPCTYQHIHTLAFPDVSIMQGGHCQSLLHA